MIRLSVVIVSYNVKSYLLNCIRSVQKSAQKIPTEIIVIDNASADQSAEAVSREFSDVILIKNEVNRGFGAACNQGLEIAKGNYLLILNPDTLVEENAFEKLLGFADENPDAGLIGCKILNEDGSLQLACRRSFPTPWIAFTRLSGLSKLFPKSSLFSRYNLTFLDENKPYEVDAISGSFMLLSRSAYEKTSGFDERFFMYGEDLDLCFRVKQGGFKVVYRPEASIIHFKGKSVSPTVDTQYHFFHAMKIFVQKHKLNHNRMTGFLNLAISLHYVLSAVKRYNFTVFSMMSDLALLLGGFALAGIVRFDNWFPYPDFVFPQLIIILCVIQVAVYGWFGVYSENMLRKRRLLSGSMIVWSIVVLIVYFTKDFAYSRVVILLSFLFGTGLQLLWRIVLPRISASRSDKKAIIISPDSDFSNSDLISLQYEMIDGISFRHDFKFSDLNGLESFISKNNISLILIDSDRMDFRLQMEIIQRGKALSVKCHVISQKVLYESLLNQTSNSDDRSGMVFKWIKRWTDRILYWEFREKLKEKAIFEKVNNLQYHPFRVKNDVFLIGTSPLFELRPESLSGAVSIGQIYKSLSRPIDQQLLNMVYNRYHNLQFDRRLLKKYLSEK